MAEKNLEHKMVSRNKARKLSSKKAVENIIEGYKAHADEVRVQKSVEQDISKLFTVDTVGKQTLKQKRKDKAVLKQPQLSKEAAHKLLLSHHKQVVRKHDKKEEQKKVKDLWGNSVVTEKIKVKHKKAPHPEKGIHKLLVAEDDHKASLSVNPDQEQWKEGLVRTVALIKAEEDKPIDFTPVTTALTDIFGAEAIQDLTVNQRILLLHRAEASKELLEEPETFLQRFKSTLEVSKEKAEVKEEPVEEENFLGKRAYKKQYLTPKKEQIPDPYKVMQEVKIAHEKMLLRKEFNKAHKADKVRKIKKAKTDLLAFQHDLDVSKGSLRRSPFYNRDLKMESFYRKKGTLVF